METKNSFTICVLLYGDFTDLAHRCLSSIARACSDALPANLRVGLNAVSPRTEKYIQSLIDNGWLLPEGVYRSEENIHKYPMMRRMLYDPERPVETPFVMWFDDDSFVKEEMVGASPNFLQRVRDVLDPPADSKAASAAMCGAIYTIAMQGNQAQWVQDQPWYGGKKIERQTRFATGGWWAARLSALKDHDYPWPELDHRGGDVMLGQLMYQQSLHLANFRDGVAVNADTRGRESKCPRRGFDQKPIGTDYNPTEARMRVSQEQAAHVTNTLPPPQQQAPPVEVPKRPRLVDRLDL